MPLTFETWKLGPLDNNVYLLVCDRTGEAAAVDVGFEPERAIDRIRALGVRLQLLLNTHAHYDHAAGMREVQLALGGEYWLHPGDRILLDRLTEQGAAFGFPAAAPPQPVHELADGQLVKLGDESLEVIATPGHSPGGVCFRWEQELWVGDTLFAGSIGRTDLPGGSFKLLERSIHERLFPLGDSMRVHPGHGPPTTIGRERLENPFVGLRARSV